jgi:SAM-dependent methyltransferase
LLTRVADSLPPGRALDLACGPGRHALFLARRGWRVTAVDSSAVGLAAFRARAEGLDIEIHQADLQAHEYRIEPCAFDLICDTFYLQRDLFPEIRAGVRHGGLFFAVIHVDDANAPPMNPRFLLRRGELLREFRDWEILHYAEIVPQIGHRRCAAELVCRKRL